jgi:hypothetical protein
MSNTWRDIAAPIIADVIAANRQSDTATLRRALREAYPFGIRKHWPYKIWCSEVRKQLGGPVKKSPTPMPDLFIHMETT